MTDGTQIPTQPQSYYPQQPVTQTPQMTIPIQAQQPVYQPQPPPSPMPPEVQPQKPEKISLPMVSFYPHIYLVAFIIHMIGLIIIFIGVFQIGIWFVDLGEGLGEDDINPNMFEDLGNHIKLLAIGGMIFAGGTATRGVAKYYDGQMDMRDRIKF